MPAMIAPVSMIPSAPGPWRSGERSLSEDGLAVGQVRGIDGDQVQFVLAGGLQLTERGNLADLRPVLAQGEGASRVFSLPDSANTAS